MRALIVGHTYVVGLNQHKVATMNLVTGCDVGFVAPRSWKSSDWKRTIRHERAHPELFTYPCSVVGSGRARVFLFNPLELGRAIDAFRPDLVQIEQEPFTAAAFQVASAVHRRGVPFVVLGHENLDRGIRIPPPFLRSFVLKHASAAIGTNQGAEALFRKWGFVGPSRVLPQLGVDTDIFRRVERQPFATMTVGFVGRLVREKGVDLLLHAVADRQLADEQVRVAICGDGPEMKNLRMLSDELGLGERVTWLGAVPHNRVAQAMQTMDVVALPSRSTSHWKEQFGHVLVEAMAMGLPVVGSDSGAIPEVIGRSQLVFPENDAGALASCLAHLCERGNYGREAVYCYERCFNEFRQEVVATRTLELWRDVVPASFAC